MRVFATLAFLAAGALAWWLTSPASSDSDSNSSLAPDRTLRAASPSKDDAGLAVSAAYANPTATRTVAPESEHAEVELIEAPRAADASVTSVVYGTVLDDRGAPIERAGAVAIDAHGVRLNQTTNADGGFAFVDLPKGKTRLQGGKLGWIDATAEFDLAEGAVQRFDLSLTRAPIVRLRCGDGAGRPVRDMVAAASFSVSTKFAIAATTADPLAVLDPPHPGGNETYDVGSLWPYQMLELPVDEHTEAAGLLVLRRPPPVWVSVVVNQRVMCKQYVRSTAELVHLTLTSEDLQRMQAALRLVVVDDATGDPVQAEIVIGSGPPLETAEDGTLALERLPSGPLGVSVEAPGFTLAWQRVSLAPGVTHDLGEVRLRRPARIAGRVVDGDGAPLLVALVVEPLEGDVGPRQRVFVQSGVGGEFTLPAFFPPGQYIVRVWGDDEQKRPGARDTIWTSTCVTVDTRLGPREDIVVVAERPIPFVVEVPPDAAPSSLRIVDAEGRVLRRWAMVPEQFWSLEPRSLKLPQGRFELIAARAGVDVGRWPLNVGSDPGGLRVELP